MARKVVTAMLFAVLGIGATACEFGEHRGSHSNVYPDEGRNYTQPYEPEYQRPY